MTFENRANQCIDNNKEPTGEQRNWTGMCGERWVGGWGDVGKASLPPFGLAMAEANHGGDAEVIGSALWRDLDMSLRMKDT